MYLKENYEHKKLEWSSLISVGLNDIDDQHKLFIDLLNQSLEALNGHDLTQAASVLKGLIEYVREHFRHEVELMQKYNYPEIHTHEESHDLFVEKVVNLKLAVKSGQHVEKEMFTILQNWLYLHIEGTDKKLADFLKRNGYTG